VSCAANDDRAPREVPQAVSVSMSQRIISQTGCGTDILAAVGQVSIVLEAIV
jgi:hypothetical protein